MLEIGTRYQRFIKFDVNRIAINISRFFLEFAQSSASQIRISVIFPAAKVTPHAVVAVVAEKHPNVLAISKIEQDSSVTRFGGRRDCWRGLLSTR